MADLQAAIHEACNATLHDAECIWPRCGCAPTEGVAARLRRALRHEDAAAAIKEMAKSETTWRSA